MPWTTINADPDMNPQSFYPNGVPDEVVRHVVWLLFYEGLQIIKKGARVLRRRAG